MHDEEGKERRMRDAKKTRCSAEGVQDGARGAWTLWMSDVMIVIDSDEMHGQCL